MLKNGFLEKIGISGFSFDFGILQFIFGLSNDRIPCNIFSQQR